MLPLAVTSSQQPARSNSSLCSASSGTPNS
jgi:hypothetical protein